MKYANPRTNISVEAITHARTDCAINETSLAPSLSLFHHVIALAHLGLLTGLCSLQCMSLLLVRSCSVFSSRCWFESCDAVGGWKKRLMFSTPEETTCVFRCRLILSRRVSLPHLVHFILSDLLEGIGILRSFNERIRTAGRLFRLGRCHCKLGRPTVKCSFVSREHLTESKILRFQISCSPVIHRLG